MLICFYCLDLEKHKIDFACTLEIQGLGWFVQPDTPTIGIKALDLGKKMLKPFYDVFTSVL